MILPAVSGDEIVLLLPDIAKTRGRAVAEHIRRAIDELPPIPTGAEHKVSASVGGTLLRCGEAKASFMERADKYLYRAKESGRHQLVWEGYTL